MLIVPPSVALTKRYIAANTAVCFSFFSSNATLIISIAKKTERIMLIMLSEFIRTSTVAKKAPINEDNTILLLCSFLCKSFPQKNNDKKSMLKLIKNSTSAYKIKAIPPFSI